MQGYLQGNLNKHAVEIQIKGQVFGFFCWLCQAGTSQTKSSQQVTCWETTKTEDILIPSEKHSDL